MNHLAHLFLAGSETESLIGNIAGDFVKGPLRDRFPAAIAAGIVQHRKIDSFTDAHPAAAAFRRVLIPGHGHWSRVIADVFFDHFLAGDFETYAHESLESFLERTWARLDPHAHELPGALAYVYPRMRDEGWLLSYREIGGIRTALANMSRRIPRRPELASAVHHLEDPQSRRELEHRFRELFPDVVAYARAIGSVP